MSLDPKVIGIQTKYQKKKKKKSKKKKEKVNN